MTRRPDAAKRATAVAVLGSLALLVAAIAACISEDPGPITASCDTYCATVEQNCTGPNRAFGSRAQCLAMCALMPQGPEGNTNANTVGCRLAAAREGGSKEKCKAAGAYGGNVCGSRCDTFCDLVEAQCIKRFEGKPPSPFPDRGVCVEMCRNVLRYDDADEEGPEAQDGVDTLNCRMLHLILSLDGAEIHCPHVAVQSDTCFAGADPDAGHGNHGGDETDAGEDSGIIRQDAGGAGSDAGD